ncbi:unnamed protein product, partial [Allacma fusca]
VKYAGSDLSSTCSATGEIYQKHRMHFSYKFPPQSLTKSHYSSNSRIAAADKLEVEPCTGADAHTGTLTEVYSHNFTTGEDIELLKGGV